MKPRRSSHLIFLPQWWHLLLCMLCLHSCHARSRAGNRNTTIMYWQPSPEDPSDRIVGGKDARLGEFSFFVEGGGCGGSLIWPDMVLSAAHCEDSLPDEWDGLLVGASRHQSTRGGAEWREIKKMWVHKKFRWDTFEYDFMMVKLRDPVDALAPIEINRNQKRPRPGKRVKALGFGRDEWDNKPTALQEVAVYSVSHNTCRRDYERMDEIILRDCMMCTGVEEGGMNTCHGDSGGPLIRGGKLVGVTSWGPDDCGDPDYPAVYSRVSAAASWIDKMICRHSSVPPADCER